jgi:hypothetical protein
MSFSPSQKQTRVYRFAQREKYAINNVLITSLVSMNKTLTGIVPIKYWGAGCWHSLQTMRAFYTDQLFPY